MKNTAVCLSPKQMFDSNCILLRAHFTEGHQNNCIYSPTFQSRIQSHFPSNTHLSRTNTYRTESEKSPDLACACWSKREVILWRWRFIAFRPVNHLIKTLLNQNKGLINSLCLLAHHLQRSHLWANLFATWSANLTLYVFWLPFL